MQRPDKGQTVDEVYNILAGCLIRALDKYDPDYTKKVQEVVRVIDGLKTPQFTSKQITKLAGFDASKICKMLVKREHLKKIANPERPKSKYLMKDKRPVDERLLNSKPIGLPYFVSYYFRQYLQQYITDQMNTREARNARCTSAALQLRSSALDLV